MKEWGVQHTFVLTRVALVLLKKKNKLGRALRASVPETLYTTLWQQLSRLDAQE